MEPSPFFVLVAHHPRSCRNSSSRMEAVGKTGAKESPRLSLVSSTSHLGDPGWQGRGVLALHLQEPQFPLNRSMTSTLVCCKDWVRKCLPGSLFFSFLLYFNHFCHSWCVCMLSTFQNSFPICFCTESSHSPWVWSCSQDPTHTGGNRLRVVKKGQVKELVRAGTSKMLKRSCLVHDLSGKLSSVSPLSITFPIGFLHMFFIKLKVSSPFLLY